MKISVKSNCAWLICFVCLIHCIYVKTEKLIRAQRVCVIGAGIAGLTSARHLKEAGIDFTVFEITQYVGGTWRYDPRVGKDEFGQPIQTSMYKHLRTNLPKPTMELQGFPVPKDYPSYPPWKMYYDYIKAYARHFDIEKYIQFSHNVISVRRVGDQWKVNHENVKTKETFEENFDFVMIGTGHHSKPNLPDIPGENLFKGTIIHSHDYREPDRYKGRRVLVMGAGPSGIDISLSLADDVSTLVHSHHSNLDFKTPFPDNYVRKPDVKEFNETGAIFKDGTFLEVDDVIYCTGFQYYYPFLDESSGLTLTSRSVAPLYKYMVNIHQPSMVFLGLIVRACLVVAIDAQARYATALAKGNFTLPPKDEMLRVWQKQLDTIRSKGRPIADIHVLSAYEDKYYEEMTEEAGIDRVPPVLYKIRTNDMVAKLDNWYTFRNYEYKIIDRETFTKQLEERSNSSCTPH